MAPAADDPQGGAPDRAGLVLVALILVAAGANLNLYRAADAEPSAEPDVPAGPPQPTPA
jgi:hypothetical protein